MEIEKERKTPLFLLGHIEILNLILSALRVNLLGDDFN